MEPLGFLATNYDIGFAEAVQETAKLLMGLVEVSDDGPLQSTWPYEPGEGFIQPEQYCALTCENVGFARLPNSIAEVDIPEALDFMVTAYYPIVQDDPEIDGLYRAQLMAQQGFGYFYDTLNKDRGLSFQDPTGERRVMWADAPAGRRRGVIDSGTYLYAYEADCRVRLH